MEQEAPPWAAESHRESSASDRTTELDPSLPEIPEEGITVTGSVPEMPHWSEPPTGEVPRLRFEDDDVEGADDMGAWRALGSRGVRWRDDGGWDEGDELSDLSEPDDERSGALDQTRTEHSDLYSFDEDFERVAASRTGSHPVVDLGAEEGDAPDEEWTPQAPPAHKARALRGRGARNPRTDRHRPRVAPPEPAAEAGIQDDEPELEVAAQTGHRRVSSARGGPARSAPQSRVDRPTDRNRPGARGGAPAGGSEMSSRLIVGGVLIALLIIASLIGPKALVVLSAIVVTAAVAEAYNMTRAPGFRPATLLGLVATIGCVLGAYWKGVGAIPIVTVLLFAGSMLWYVTGVVEARPLANAAVTVMVFVWVSVLGSFSAVLLGLKSGEGLFLGAVLVAVAADVFAFGVGRWIGSRPMAESISPHKTIEGYLGGVAGALIVGAIVGKELHPWSGMRYGLLLGLVIGLIAPVGDLFESMLKRDLGLKDSGRVLGGHGGLLDRFDALLLALPAAYFVATIAHIAKP